MGVGASYEDLGQMGKNSFLDVTQQPFVRFSQATPQS